ncbi:Carboxylic ester hydrolase [Mycena sanguinolenta]|uniref:Carboxylic ester hydrolase n=1 Tax=Mycena sanguinolenta TaxID=230812 RepID=A0A8H7CPH9_9AGAR|nr:Carboxylic ester hydrolase [Mycena sanguinolenta]
MSFAILSMGLLFLASWAAAAGPVVDLGYAQYQGVVDTDSNITKFLGMRFAAAPTGNLRWRMPTAPPNVDGIQRASADPTQCIQGAIVLTPPNTSPQSEDCLFLSVYSPDLNPTQLLPTIVWIHGGGYIWGSAFQYNGTDLVVESHREVVVVVIQWRLGLFGFLAGQQVKDDGVLNAGLREYYYPKSFPHTVLIYRIVDQEFALRWVNKNIHKFGGDPDKVSLWGESAGAGSVLQHIIAHNGQTIPQLFRAAITSSAYLPSQYWYHDSIPQNLFDNISAQAGCGVLDALDCLRTVDTARLQEINQNIISASLYGTTTFGPVVDGSFITQSPMVALEQRRVNGEILLSATNAHEGTLFVNQSADYDVAQYAQQLFPLFGAKEGKAVAAVYQSFGSSQDQVTAIMGESRLICPTYLLLNGFEGRAYKGEFAVPPALHGDDLYYYFASFSPGVITFNNTAFINAFNGGFLSFATNLDPNIKLLQTITPPWSKWAPAAEEMVFNRTEAGEPWIYEDPTSDALLARCEFWKSLRNITAQ